MKTVLLLCGVPGSGKSWICSHDDLKGKFSYVSHDEHAKDDLASVIFRFASMSERPVLADCPFAERKLREDLEALGLKVIPYFVIETPSVVKRRYEKREGREIPKQHLTRATSILNRATEWGAGWGTSEEILEVLKGL